MKTREHGGHSWEAARELSCRVDEILDFSANLNPLGPPEKVRALLEDPEKLLALPSRYPQHDYRPLKKALRKKFQVPENEILVGNGASELICQAIAACDNILIPEPTYSEYEKACRHQNKIFSFYSWRDFLENPESLGKALEQRQAELVVLPLPNNPTGDLPQTRVLEDLFRTRQDTRFLIDTSFLLFSENFESLWPKLSTVNVINVMSLTKFYTLPGLRLGWMRGDAKRIQKLAKSLPPWSVNALAAEAGRLCLEDEFFGESSRTWLEKTRKNFCEALGKLFPGNEEIAESQANFLVLNLKNSEEARSLKSFLYRKRILVRAMDNFSRPACLRLAVRSEKDNRFFLEQCRLFLEARAGIREAF
jgi:histidinol-phosphate/aromatic aminotransferase/cobyric acid decarboxylase-like protein